MMLMHIKYSLKSANVKLFLFEFKENIFFFFLKEDFVKPNQSKEKKNKTQKIKNYRINMYVCMCSTSKYGNFIFFFCIKT